MDFCFSPEEEEFRKEVGDFLRETLPSDWKRLIIYTPIAVDNYATLEKEIRRKLGEKGWLSISWPREYGGQDASYIKRFIFAEEWFYQGAPGYDPIGVGYLAPTLIVHGTEEQKREHLPRIGRGEVMWCQGYSEPGSGSDLASLQTQAVEDGDDYVINGQKIWTTNAHKADWIFLLARTDHKAPQHKGITFFLVGMKSPGITVRPLVNMAGGQEFNEVFFEDVRVPKTNIIGEVNRGWYVAVTALNFERSCFFLPAVGRRFLDLLVEYVINTARNGDPLADDPLIKHKLAEMAIEIEVGRLLFYRQAWMLSRGLIPSYESSIAKLYSTELLQRIAAWGMELLGLCGQLGNGTFRAPLRGLIKDFYLHSISGTVGAGTSEIQRNIVAQRGLGLPR
ncbi:MAG: acyl-CoA dehydrogenase family protein [Dehalococcoidia bacterium]